MPAVVQGVGQAASFEHGVPTASTQGECAQVLIGSDCCQHVLQQQPRSCARLTKRGFRSETPCCGNIHLGVSDGLYPAGTQGPGN
jgi:hypothetical protein